MAAQPQAVLAIAGPTAPQERPEAGRVLEYVVWHEVCHLEILDHSPRFWALLGRHWPGYREDRLWLRRHGATLVL